jgi:hypothetical protein
MYKRKSKYGVHRVDFNSDLEYQAAFQRAYRKAHVGFVRKCNLGAKGITPEDYDRMFVAQEGMCAVCKTTETGSNQHGKQSFCVDHNHETGKVRGLLCHNCNRAEGLLKGNAQALADYLKRYE